MNFDQLRALTAIVDEGTFEAAADLFGVTPSAISQRIKALEASVGHVVIRRSVPCVPTEAGETLVQLARQVQLLQDETLERLGTETSGRTHTPVAVNADSLATWFPPVLEAASGWDDTLLDLHVEDQDHSSSLLRRGDVLGAITAIPRPVHGCTVEPLGRMRYVPVVSPRLLARHAPISLVKLPMVQFNAKDDLQAESLRSVGVHQRPPTHTIPSFDGFFAGIRAGLGWGMITEIQWQGLPDNGGLVILSDLAPVDVDLYWQSWTLRSARLVRLRDAIHEAASDVLRAPREGRARRPST